MHRHSFATPRSLWLLFAIVLSWGAPHDAMADPPCPAPQSIAPGENLRIDGLESGSQILEIELPTAGLLALEATVPASESAVPWIDLLDSTCRPLAAQATVPGHSQVLYRSLSRQVVVAGAGLYRIGLGAVGATATTILRAATRFVSLEEAGLSDLFPVLAQPNLATYNGDDEEEDASESEGTEEAVNEIFPSTALPVPLSFTYQDLAELFRSTAACASPTATRSTAICALPIPLETPITNLFEGSNGIDPVVHLFTLDKTTTVRIEGHGRLATQGSLYDQHGQRLLVDDGDEGESFVLEATLGAGTYWVRIEGLGGKVDLEVESW